MAYEIPEIENSRPKYPKTDKRFLKAGVMENGTWELTLSGTPQGSIISPILANIYLHYALDLWFKVAVKKACRGEANMIRYADDCAPRKRSA
ncbi:reverse transcriptase domain-containing protein [Microaerobacter geothermalis]|uniref:reverse transcriptase domain-containing protein n=1 Tax=Microaerobacter geothermalis TaxID=674972 RepID=UPI002E333443|nr:reverse transcriptase domain-containing protein [Microaerobacter geothermalis]